MSTDHVRSLFEEWNQCCYTSLKKFMADGPLKMYYEMIKISKLIQWDDKNMNDLIQVMFIKLSFIELEYLEAIELLESIFVNFGIWYVELEPGTPTSCEDINESINLNGKLILKFARKKYIFKISLENIFRGIIRKYDFASDINFCRIIMILKRIENMVPKNIIHALNRQLTLLKYKSTLLYKKEQYGLDPPDKFPEIITQYIRSGKFCFTNKPDIYDGDSWIDSSYSKQVYTKHERTYDFNLKES